MAKSPVFFGGPVDTDRGFVLHNPRGGWKSTLPIKVTAGRPINPNNGVNGVVGGPRSGPSPTGPQQLPLQLPIDPAAASLFDPLNK